LPKALGQDDSSGPQRVDLRERTAAQNDRRFHAVDRDRRSGPPSKLINAELSEDIPWGDEEVEIASLEESTEQDRATDEPSRPSPRAADSNNSALASSGRESFNRACTACHDAERALSKRKTLGSWRSTIRRMASKSGANIPSGDWEAIAAYLTAQGNPIAAGEGDSGKSSTEQDSQTPSLSVYGTFSPLFRGGSDNLQNPGFFPETWLGASWQSESVLSARATVCISCHNENGLISRVEVVEAALRLDLAKWFATRHPQVRATLDAGRFIVPFGAFSAQSNPGVYRTVTKPLIFNMGQRVFNANLGDSVLPMPYADEGANFNLSVPVDQNVNGTIDVYLVNGLQGSINGVDFLMSRDYVDNNSNPAAGGRVTLGNQFIRAGGSITGGRFNSSTGFGATAPTLDYQIFGFDIQAHYEDLIRVQAEYARRDSDRQLFVGGMPVITEHISGFYVEGELRVYCKPRISVLARYDGQDHHSPVPVPGSALDTGNFGVRRFTYGLNVTLPGGSLLMINHEHWWLPGGLDDIDVIGARWAATF
jgi:mono/diheme cytochrome c family protein